MRRLMIPGLAAILVGLGPAAHGGSASEHRAAMKELARAAEGGDSTAFVASLGPVLARQDAASVRAVLGGYARIAPAAAKKLRPEEFMRLHGQTAAAFAALRSKEGIAELRRLLARGKDWQERLLALEASTFIKGLDPTESCIAALGDAHPIVVRRALHYLARAKKVPVAEAIVKRYADLEAKKAKDPDPQWSRTLLAFQSTLQRMLHVDLPAGIDYKNYFDARKSDPDLFEPKKSREGRLTGATLFGTAVTGKFIVFVLDVSGSMLSTDPLGDEEAAPRRPRTAVGKQKDEGKDEAREEPPSERQRMLRAKNELAKVVRALPEDVRFNIITYSSDVTSWKNALVPATDSNKKEAVSHIEGLRAEGVTVTDLALEAAFSHLDVDTIYLVTDGVPTHVGSSGPLPEDAPMIIRQIHDRVRELNFLRGVRIFTLGFELAEEEFLKKLSADNAGTYARIE